jgi:hypothetical protein
MKTMKTIYTVLLSAITLSVFAQPTINSSWAPGAGIQVNFHAFDASSGLSEGAAGASQNWDLSVLDTLGAQRANYIASASAPMGSSFPTATVCLAALSSSGNNTYTFYRKNGNTYQVVGLYQPATSYVMQYTDPQDVFHFPSTYNGTFNDVARVAGTFNSGGPGTLRRTVNTTVTADGYGTLITRSGTFNNVMRFLTIQDINDTLVQNNVPYYLVYHYETYNWISPSLNGVILAAVNHSQVNGQQQNDNGYYTEVISTGIASLADAGISGWSVIPQPAADKATVLIQSTKDGADATIQVYDMTGRLMSTDTQVLSAATNEVPINVSALANGIYALAVTVDGRTETRKLSVKH